MVASAHISHCKVLVHYVGIMASLLDPPSEAEAAEYHKQVLSRFAPQAPAVEVRADAGGGRGKGLFATRAIEEGEVIFTERALAGVQHAENKEEIPACPHCFRAIVTPEGVVASLLCSLIGRLSGDDGHGGASSSGGRAGGAADSDESGSEDGFSPEEAVRRAALIEAAVDAPTLQGLIDGSARLPRSALIETPEPTPCAGGCGERYCSAACAAAAWDAYHCLLCPVGACAENDGGTSTSSSSKPGTSKPTSSSSKGKGALKPKPGARGSGGGGGSDAEEEVRGVTVRRRRLAAFFEHADEFNDEFRLAAHVLAIVLVRADEALRKASSGSRSGDGGGGDGDAAPSEAARAAALREAWLPFAVAEKAPYWRVASFGSGDGDEEEDEAEYRAQMRELTAESLRLLRAAWPRARWPELLELGVYGSVVGMFEQNNLALNIPSPAERYFGLPLDAEALPDPAERAALARQQKPLRDALGDELEASIEGTAFYALQSCCNHACNPSAAAEGEPSGAARIIALRGIPKGGEVTLSYVEVEECDGYKERRAALRGYGFECACELCQADELAARASAAVAL